MRYNVFVLLFLLIVVGCKQNSNPVAPVIRPIQAIPPILGASNVKDSILYYFVIPKEVFGTHDTLSATLTVYNQSASTDTFVLRGGSVFYAGLWSLKNGGGRTLMFGPDPIPQNVEKVPLGPHQSLSGLVIDQVIADTSGAPVIPGSYILLEQFCSFTLELHIYLQ